MKIYGRLFSYIGIGITALSVFSAYPSQASAELKMTGGTTVCNGTFFYRDTASEVHMGTWNFTNYNDDVTIKFDHVQVFTADGLRFLDYPSEQFPVPPPGTKSELTPHQSTVVRFVDVFGGPNGYLPPEKRPVQLVVDWSIPEGRGYALDGDTISVSQVAGIQNAVNSVKCRLIRSEWR